MSKVQNFKNEFTLHIENEMPKVIKRLNEEKEKFERLTSGLYNVLRSAYEAIEKEGLGFMQLNYKPKPEMEDNYVMSTKISIVNLNDHHNIEIYYVGGDSSEVVVEGVDEFSHHFKQLKGVKLDVGSKDISIPLDTPPDDLAWAFAQLLTDFYRA